MLEWLGGIFRRFEDEERNRFSDSLNVQAGGGKPTLIEQSLGTLPIPSRTLALGDPMNLLSVEIPNFAAERISVSAKLWKYPSGHQTVTELVIVADTAQCVDSSHKVGDLAIDSAKVVVADKRDIEEHWTETGKDRIGVISTAPDDTLLRKLTKRFKLKTARVNPVRTEIVGPVSEQLERDIEAYLKSVPEYAEFSYLYFYVQTNNSFDRVNRMRKPWDFMPVGNNDLPIMFACGTGRGDGFYAVNCGFAGDSAVLVTIPFIEDDGA